MPFYNHVEQKLLAIAYGDQKSTFKLFLCPIPDP